MTRAARVSAQAGVSLLEVLAALAIIAVMAMSVVAVLRPADRAEQIAAEALTRSLLEARQHALVTGQVIGFSADADRRGYRFYTYTDGAWRLVGDHPAFQPVRFSDPELEIAVEAGAIPVRAGAPPGPQVWFDPTGFDAPFQYALRTAGGAVRVRRDAAGAVALEPLPDAGEAA